MLAYAINSENLDLGLCRMCCAVRCMSWIALSNTTGRIHPFVQREFSSSGRKPPALQPTLEIPHTRAPDDVLRLCTVPRRGRYGREGIVEISILRCRTHIADTGTVLS
jgi:hypothetical protein